MQSGYLYSNFYVTPTSICEIPVFQQGKKYKSVESQLRSLENLKVNRTKGTLSRISASKLRYSINLLTAIAKPKRVYCKTSSKNAIFKVNFITLTLSSKQVHSDNFIKRYMLHGWLKEMKRRIQLVNYVWKAEAQQNGNIHFHITTDKYIDYSVIRDAWNLVQSRYGYISSFLAVNGHDNPNSTDVHSVKNIDNLAGYLVKYMCKDTAERRKITGSLWGCSDTLKRRFYVSNVVSSDINTSLYQAQAIGTTYKHDYFTHTTIKHTRFPKHLRQLYNKFLSKVSRNVIGYDLFSQPILQPITPPPPPPAPPLILEFQPVDQLSFEF